MLALLVAFLRLQEVLTLDDIEVFEPEGIDDDYLIFGVVGVGEVPNGFVHSLTPTTRGGIYAAPRVVSTGVTK